MRRPTIFPTWWACAPLVPPYECTNWPAVTRQRWCWREKQPDDKIVRLQKESYLPLRDHFRPPLSTQSSWEEVHGGWPMVIVQQLGKLLPPQYVAAPRVHLGSQAEIDIEAFDRSERGLGHGTGASGLATAVWAPARTRKGGREREKVAGTEYRFSTSVFKALRSR